MTVAEPGSVRAIVVRRAVAPDGAGGAAGAAGAGRSEDAEVGIRSLREEELGEGELLVRVAWSGLNYKDGLALAGARGVMRVDPLVPGIDLVGEVLESESERFAPGDAVVLTGAGLGETRHGGYAERARIPADLVVPVRAGLGARRSAAIGTAGFSAAQAVIALERHGLPDGPVLVTGASGGVGSIAIALLVAAGHRVAASTGSPDHADRLREMGASEIVDRAELAEAGRALQSSRWAGAVDGVGGATLHNVIAQLHAGGAVAAVGLVQDARLDTTVHPFILRGVALLGVNSVEASLAEREAVWDRLERDLDPAVIDALTTEVGLDGVIEAGARIRAGATRGRVVVRVGG